MVEDLKNKVLAGGELSLDEACHLMDEAPLSELSEAAHEITVKKASRLFDMCSIINAKSGRCPENCKWCAQSVHYQTTIETYPLVDKEECLHHARKNEEEGVKRFSLVTSGRRPTDKEVDKLCEHVTYLRAHSGIRLCASLGLATYEQLKRLHTAGVERYHCNLETAPSFFFERCSTHTQEEKIATLQAARSAGMDICSGGIVGMGETARQRVELALVLRELGVNSIPINLLQPIPGTPLEGMAPLTSEEVLRTVAVFRFVHQEAYLRLAGGRSLLCEKTLCQALHAGVNAAIVGNLLTTLGSKVEEDKKCIKEAGYEL